MKHLPIPGAVAVALSLVAPMTQAIPLSFTAISTPFNTPIGIDYFEPDNKVAMSVNYAGGSPYNFELVGADGSRTQFSSIAGFTDEVKIATVRSPAKGGFDYGVGPGFAPGTLFTGNGIDGQIVQINPDTSFVNPFVALAGSGNGLMRGSLYVDRSGVYNGDLLAATTAGEVWRVTPGGAATLLADVDTHLEGLLSVPNDLLYGGLAGKIIAGAEGVGLLYVFDENGFVTTYDIDVNIEDLDLIPENENFFGVNFGTSQLLGVEASQWNSVEGEILVTQEFAALYTMHWDFGLNKPIAELVTLAPGSAPAGQWEHVTFAPAGIREIPPIGNVPEPTTLALTGLGLLALRSAGRRSRASS